MKLNYNLRAQVRFITMVLLCMNCSFLQAQQWFDLGNLSYDGIDVGLVNNIEGYASGVYFCTNRGVFRSTDYGNTFTNLTFGSGVTAGLEIYSLFIDEVNSTMYVGSASAVFKSTDMGSTWNTTAINSATTIVRDIEKVGNTMYVCFGQFYGNGGVYYSNDDLVTATLSSDLMDVELVDLFPHNNEIWAAGESGLYVSSDGGVNWSVQGTGHSNAGKYRKVLEKDGDFFVSDEDSFGVYKSNDQGANWFVAGPSGNNDFCQIHDITNNSDTLYATVEGGDCYVFNDTLKVSTDNGVTWSSGMYNIVDIRLGELGVSVDGCVFVYAIFDHILYRSCEGTLNIPQTNTTDFTLSPNPTNGNFSISGITNANVFIYNAQGIGVKQLTNVPANKTIDISEVASGIYFVKVQTDIASKTFKLLKK